MAKIALSLPDQMLKVIEKERKARGLSRSEFLREAVERLLREERVRLEKEQYIRGYLEHPETEEEMAWAEAASAEVLAEYPWEEEPTK